MAENTVMELGNYIGIEVPKIPVEVTDEEVTRELTNACSLAATYEEKDENQPAEMGDMLTIDFNGFLDGEPFEGGDGVNYPLPLGSHTFIDGFEEQLVGSHVGDEVEVNLNFPENYAEGLSGKPVVFKVKIKDIHYNKIPGLTDKVVQKVSKCQTVDEFKDYVRNEILKEKKKDAQARKERMIVDKIIADSKLNIPQEHIESRAALLKRNLESQLQLSGQPLETYLEYNQMTKEKYNEYMLHDARVMLEGQAILGAIADKEGITYTDEELEEELQSVADNYGREKEEARKMLGDRGMQMIAQDLRTKKALDLISRQSVETDPE